MTPLHPRALSWQGTLPVDALWLDPALLGEAGLRQRVLSLWSSGCVADHLHDGVLLRFPSPRRIEARAAPGVLLCREGRCLWAAPLTPAERDRLAAPPGSVVLLRGGEAVVVPLSAGEHLDPAVWLDTTALGWHPTATLGAPPPAPAPAPGAPDLQARLGVMPSEEVRALFGDLTPGTGTSTDSPAPVGWGWTPSGMAQSALRTSQGWMGQAASSMGSGLGGLRSLFEQGERWLDTLAARMGVLDALQKLSDQRGAQHLRSLLGKLDRGDTDDALRHAIPLSRSRSGGGAAGGGGALAGGLADLFGWSSSRSMELTSPGPRRVSSMTLGETLFQRLEELYRAAFARLDAADRHREAAYVLAELLDEPQEAARYLEEKGELVLAAELAEAKRLELPYIARLWMKAGRPARVLLMLRLTDRFADTVKVLEEAGDADGADWLRRRWAQHLAHAGRFGAAVEVIWPLEAARPHALRWLDQAIGLGGSAGAQAVGRKLALHPEQAAALAEPIRPYLRDDSPEGQSTRLVLARALTVPAGAALARPLLRQLLLEQATTPTLPGRWEVLRALAAVADPALEVDLPDTLRSGAAPQPLRAFTVTAEDTGARAALDAGVVRGGRVLVALGEGGCLLLGSDGRPEQLLDVPAERLVIAESGVKALALVQRGDRWHITHLDLATRQAHPWPQPLSMRAFATAYDGDLWFVDAGDALVALDAQGLGVAPQTLWSSVPLGTLLQIHWSPRQLVAVAQPAPRSPVLGVTLPRSGPEHHRYMLPGPVEHRVIRHAPLPVQTAADRLWPLSDELACTDPSQNDLLLVGAAGHVALSPPLLSPLTLLASHPVQGLLAVETPDGVQILKRSRAGSPDYEVRFQLHAGGAARWRARIAEDSWVFCDDRGRVIAVRTDGPHPTLLMSSRVTV